MKEPLADLPETIEATLDMLCRLGEQGKIECTVVTLHLRSGRDISGYLLGRGRDPRAATLVLRGEDEGRRPSDDVTLISVSAVEGVTLRAVPRLAAYLGAQKPPPSRLDVERQALEAARAVSAARGKALQIELGWEKGTAPDSGRAWAELLRRATAALLETLGDAVGKEAMAPLARVVLREGPKLQAARQEDSLLLVAPLTAEVPDESQIKQAFDDAL